MHLRRNMIILIAIIIIIIITIILNLSCPRRLPGFWSQTLKIKL